MILAYLSTMGIVDRIIFCLPFILPFLFHPLLPNSYEFPKFIVFTISVQLLLLIRLLKRFSLIKIYSKYNALFLFVCGFVVVTAFANIIGIDPKVSLLGSEYRHQGFVTLLSGFTLFLLVRTIKVKENSLFTASAVTSFSLFLYSLCQAIAFFLFNDSSIPAYQGRIIATMGNPNFLGGYVVMLLPFILFTHKPFQLKIFLVVLIFLTLLFTQSISSLLAFFVILFLFFLIHKNQPIPIQTLTRLVIVSILIIIAVSIGIIRTYNIEKSKLSLQTQAEHCLFLLTDTSAKKLFFAVAENMQPFLSRISFCEGRTEIWGVGIEAVLQRPLLGYGQENFELIFPEDRYIKVDNAHNIFLETAVSSGLLGLTFFLLILKTMFKKANRPVKLSLGAFLIVAFFNPLSITQIAFFWFLVGLTENRVIRGE